jgi:hypothetical protein
MSRHVGDTDADLARALKYVVRDAHRKGHEQCERERRDPDQCKRGGEKQQQSHHAQHDLLAPPPGGPADQSAGHHPADERDDQRGRRQPALPVQREAHGHAGRVAAHERYEHAAQREKAERIDKARQHCEADGKKAMASLIPVHAVTLRWREHFDDDQCSFRQFARPCTVRGACAWRQCRRRASGWPAGPWGRNGRRDAGI